MRWLPLLICLLLAPLARAEGLLVIASPQVPVDAVSTGELAAIYLTKKKSWADGTAIVPVNREAASRVRAQFSQDVFDHTPREVAEYWNRLRFQGKLPPPVQTSDKAVLGFVRSVPGAIGYIDAAAQTPSGVKVLARLP